MQGRSGDADVENRRGRGREAEGAVNWAGSTGTYTLVRKTGNWWKLLCSTGALTT